MWHDAQAMADDGLRKDAQSRANLATATAVIGVAGLGVGVALWFLGAPKEGEPSVSAAIDDREASLVVTGRF